MVYAVIREGTMDNEGYLSQHPMFDHPIRVQVYRDGEIRVYQNDNFAPPRYIAEFVEITRRRMVLGYRPTPDAAIAALVEHL